MKKVNLILWIHVAVYMVTMIFIGYGFVVAG